MCQHILYIIECPTGEKPKQNIETFLPIIIISQKLLTGGERRVIACIIWNMLSSEVRLKGEATELGEGKPDWALGFVQKRSKKGKCIFKKPFSLDFKTNRQATESKGSHSSLSYGGNSLSTALLIDT